MACSRQIPSGVLVPNAKLRAAMRMSWTRLLKRVFDIKHCTHCGGHLKIIAAIEDPAMIVSILTHPGLPARAPPRSPALRVDLFQAV